jgi:hypothetical protein
MCPFRTSSSRRRSVQRGGLLFWALLVLAGAAAGAFAVFYLVVLKLEARLLVTDAPLKAYVDQPLGVTATVLNELDIELDDTVSTRVPVDELLSVPVEQPLELIAEFDAVVPIRVDVPVRDVILLEQKIAIDTIVEADLLGETFRLPLRGSFPVRAEVPVNLIVPIDQPVRMAFTAPIKARLRQNLEVPLKTEIVADIPLQTRMTVPVLNDLEVSADVQRKPALDVQLNYADLAIALGKIRIGFGDDSAPAPAEAQDASTP